jgi:3-dehydroquinate dehydratase-1
MTILRPKICGCIVEADVALIERMAPLVDLFELRLDLIGDNWREIVSHLKKPWIACNRSPEQGGQGETDAGKRLFKLHQAIACGAAIVDIEWQTPSLTTVVASLNGQVETLVSWHDFSATPPQPALLEIVRRQSEAGAAIVKVAAMSRSKSDALRMLRLFPCCPNLRLVAVAMGSHGTWTRVVAPFCGAYFTYAALSYGKEAAPGQLTVVALRQIYANAAKNLQISQKVMEKTS